MGISLAATSCKDYTTFVPNENVLPNLYTFVFFLLKFKLPYIFNKIEFNNQWI